MLKKWSLMALAGVMVVALSGCATSARKQKDVEIEGLKNQISLLESQIQSKDEELNSCREAVARQSQQPQVETAAVAPVSSKKKVIPEVKNRPTHKQIQIALTNAGYDPGKIDGKMGRQTKDAIMTFQRAHDIKADGKVGAKTWELLREFLYKKSK